MRPRSRDMFCPSLCNFVAPLPKQRAQGKPGADCTRGLVCQNVHFGAHEHTGSAETARLSPRNGFTAYFVLSPASEFVLSPSPAKTYRRLGTSNGCQDH